MIVPDEVSAVTQKRKKVVTREFYAPVLLAGRELFISPKKEKDVRRR